MKPKNSQKSGFVQGRSKSRPSLSAGSKKKKEDKKDEKYKKKLHNIEKAKEDLADILARSGKKHKRPSEEREDGAGMDEGSIDDQISIFENELGTVRKIISNTSGDYNAEAVSKMLLRSMLAMTIDIIPIAERAFRQTRKENAAYAVNALINQAREIDTDLRMSGNVDNQSKFIREIIVTPLFNAQAQNMLHEMLTLKSSIDTEVQSSKVAKVLKRQVDSTLKVIAAFMDKAREKMASDIESYLSGDMAAVGSDKPKKKKKRSHGD